jgi:hypothetical protein
MLNNKIITLNHNGNHQVRISYKVFLIILFHLDPSPTFRPRQVQQSYRARFPGNNNNNNNQQFTSYNNVPPPSNLAQSKPQQSGIRFQLNTRPQTAATTNKSGRRTRFSSPPKQQGTSFSSSYPTPMPTPPENRHDDTMMDTTNSNEPRPIMSAIQAFKLACDKQNWPDSLK